MPCIQKEFVLKKKLKRKGGEKNLFISLLNCLIVNPPRLYGDMLSYFDR